MGYQAIVAAAALGYQIYSGEDQKRRAELNESRQNAIRKKAEAESLAARSRAQQDVAKANRRKPDVSALLAAAQESAAGGGASTMLTGGGGSRARLMTPTLLGS